MPRAKDAKVWNADLVLAFEARAQQSRAQGKNTCITWQTAAETIEAVRKDIYQAKTGRIYNLPENKLGKNALTLARDIMEIRKEILPDGHIPHNQEQAAQMGDAGNWDSYPYLKRIKNRGGAYAILMAFHHSSTKTLAKDQICRLAQDYCDEEMEANYHAGRMHGAWSSNETLCKHNLLVKKGGNGLYVAGVGFRTNGPSRLTLTRDGEKFTEAMLRKFSNSATASQAQGAPASPSTLRQASAPILFNEFIPQAVNRVVSITARGKKSTSMKESDKLELRQWLFTAKIGHQKDFDVSKVRRQNLHDLCDSFEMEMPGLKLNHESVEGGRGRMICITLTAATTAAPKISSTVMPKCEPSRTPGFPTKRPLASLESYAGKGHMLIASVSSGKKSRSLSVREAAANAALKRAAFHKSKGMSTEIKPPPPPARKKLFDENKTVNLLSDNDSDEDDMPPPSGISRMNPVKLDIEDDCRKKPAKKKGQHIVLDLCNNSERTIAVKRKAPQEVIILDSDDDDEIVASEETPAKRVINPYAKAKPKSNNSSSSLNICIDDRERNRNATPRRLRTELMRLLERGALRDIWPQNMEDPTVQEIKLRFGDFSFDVGGKRLGVAVERKQIRDLVQRSTNGDHWKQLGNMRDNFRHSVLLIEVDPRQAARFEAHGSQNLETWNPFNTVIDDENSFYLFLGRALLSHRSVKFIQTREFQGSLRAVGALGLIAASLEIDMEEDAEQHARPRDERTLLMKRLTSAGIPLPLADQVAKEYGSANHLDKTYHDCFDENCRAKLLEPLVKHTDLGDLFEGSASAWSEAVFRSFYSIHSNTSVVATFFQNFRDLVEDHGELLCCLHQKKDTNAALDSILSQPKTRQRQTGRIVRIDLCRDQASIFPPQTEESFYAINASASQPFGASVQTLVLTTCARDLLSSKIVVQILSGKFFVHEVKAAMNRIGSDYIKTARIASASIMKAAKVAGLNSKDRRVLIIRGLPPAIEAEAKKAGYRSELKTLLDLVSADLMLEHDVVVIQAFRQTGDVELVLLQLALACYHYQLLTERTQS